MKLSLVIPAYNEGSNIVSLVRGLCKALNYIEDSFEIIMVDDGSTDQTPEILAALTKEIAQLKIVSIFPNQGYGNAILRGLEVAQGTILGWLSADSQIRPEDVVVIYRKLARDGLDLCKGVRIKRNESVFRRIQSAVYNVFFRFLFCVPYRDINGTPKIFRRSLFESLVLSSKDWFLDPEIMIQSIRKGAKIGEIEVRWRKRLGGKSKVAYSASLGFIKNMIKYRFFQGGLEDD